MGRSNQIENQSILFSNIMSNLNAHHSILAVILILINSGCRLIPDGPVEPSGEVPEATGWNMEIVADGLEHPWSIAWVSEGEALITERPGRLRILRSGQILEDPVQGLPEILTGGQAGLLDVTLHPDFENNRLLYFSYASGSEEVNRTTVGRAIFDGEKLLDFEAIFLAIPDKSNHQHFGSRILWISATTFLLSVGDGGNRPQRLGGELIRKQAQKKDSHLGKILHLDEHGRPLSQNPFYDSEAGLPEIWTLGHRNIQGLALHPESGSVWANEHGSRGGDELNLIIPGNNYGWPEITYSREYYGPRISHQTTAPGMTDPKVVWTPAQAPSGLTFYYGEKFPEWQGDLFSGGLRGEQVRRIMLEGEIVTGEETLIIGRRIRDVTVGPDGYIYLLTDESNGALIRIIPE
jgi:aldose sugar dehydrogenase